MLNQNVQEAINKSTIEQHNSKDSIVLHSPPIDSSATPQVAQRKKREISMLNENVQEAINPQIRNEVFSAYLYLSMSGYFEQSNLPGFAKWMRVQHEEALEHAQVLWYCEWPRWAGHLTACRPACCVERWAKPAFVCRHPALTCDHTWARRDSLVFAKKIS
jgi:Ferritin-like domain